jgi:hypothetical protein
MEKGKIYRIRTEWTKSFIITDTVKEHGHLWLCTETEDENGLVLLKSVSTGGRAAFYDYEMEAADAE